MRWARRRSSRPTRSAPDARRAYWDGQRLVLERGGTISGQTVSMKQSLTFDPDRKELILERLVIVQHGYTLRGTKNYATVKDVFARGRTGCDRTAHSAM